MTSIWENDFYKTPPQPLWAFEVVFDQYKDLDPENKKNEILLLNSAVKSTTINEKRLQVVPTYFAGVEFRHAARMETAGELTINFNENENLVITSILHNLWNKTAMNQHWPHPRGEEQNTNEVYRVPNGDNKIVVKILKPDANMIYSTDSQYVSKVITYYNCKLMNIGEVELDYSSEEVMSIAATFSYDYFKIESYESVNGTPVNQTPNMAYS